MVVTVEQPDGTVLPRLVQWLPSAALDEPIGPSAQLPPAQIDGATRTRRASQSVVPDVDELTRIADLIEPARFKALILNSAWCCLRYDEVTELRPQGYWRRCRSHRWLEEIV